MRAYIWVAKPFKTMKHILSILSIGLGLVSVSGQNESVTRSPFSLEAAYAEFAVGVGNESSLVGITAELYSGWGIAVGKRDLFFDSPYKPSDYKENWLFGFDRYGYTMDRVHQTFIAGTYTFQEKKRNRKLTIACGPTLDRIERVSFKRVDGGAGWFTPEYDYEVSRRWRRDVGFLTRLKAHLPFGRYAGFTAGLFGSFNSYKPVFGGEMGLSIGLIRRTNRNPN
jgi:hypothetical protein